MATELRGPAAAPGDVHRAPERLVGLDLLRALAVVLVLYLSLANWLRRHGETNQLMELVDTWIIGPTHVNQDFGFFGFALFLLLSGFLAAQFGTLHGGVALLAHRFTRVVPSLAVVGLATGAAVVLGLFRLPSGALSDMAVVSYFREPFVPLVGLAWTLLSILAGYLLLATMHPVLRREPWLAIGLQVTIYAGLVALARQDDGALSAVLGTIGGFGPVVVLGQLGWLVHARRISWAGGCVLGAWCWGVFLWADDPGYGRHADSYPLTLAVATLLLLIAVLAGRSVPRTATVDYLAQRSYPIFLVHQPIGYPVLAACTGVLGGTAAALLALVATALVAELVYQGVERPCAPLRQWVSRSDLPGVGGWRG